MDFTLRVYQSFLEELKDQHYAFQTFEEFISNPEKRVVILRHDVDRLPDNAVKMARNEASQGIRASYHFRIEIGRKRVDCLNEIISLGHEIAYHYEDLSRQSGSVKNAEKVNDAAYESFRENLEFFRQYFPVRVISMHGDPMSPVDNRKLWEFSSYREFAIICEPYFDIDYSDVLYLTDTGRRWNSDKSNIRDRTDTEFGFPGKKSLSSDYSLKGTKDILSALGENLLPQRIIINTHPQRWTNDLICWFGELVQQNLKNIIKAAISQRRIKQHKSTF